jgi:hypothetical protein
MQRAARIVREKIHAAIERAYEVFLPRQRRISTLYSQAPRRAQKIPNVVYQTWKKAELPSFHARGVRRFRELNYDYSFRFFDDNEMNEYMESFYAAHPILTVFHDIRVPAAKADIWRYCVLFREGGIYCDIDSALSVPFRDILKDDPSELISFEPNRWRDHLELGMYADPEVFIPAPSPAVARNLEHPDNILVNWLLCFEKGSPILEEVINLIVRHFHFFKGKEFDSMLEAVIHCTGPIALTQALWQWMNKSGRRPLQLGIDFNGQGVYKLSGSDKRYADSPRYTTFLDRRITVS